MKKSIACCGTVCWIGNCILGISCLIFGTVRVILIQGELWGGYMILAVFGASFSTALLGRVLLIPQLQRTGITGKDMHKVGKPEVAEMGSLAMSLFAHV